MELDGHRDYDSPMTETYTSGVWTVKDGEEEAFVEAWREFVAFGGKMPGSGTFRLVRDVEQPERYMSFAPWESFEAQHDWKLMPEFTELIGAARAHCEDFQPAVYELVTTVE